MSDWATDIAKKNELKAGVLEIYDGAVGAGYEPPEARLLVKGAVPAQFWLLAEYWLNQERPV